MSQLTNLRLVLALPTFKRIIAQVRDRNETADVAHVNSVGVRHLEEPLSEELGGAVSDLAISFHLSET